MDESARYPTPTRLRLAIDKIMEARSCLGSGDPEGYITEVATAIRKIREAIDIAIETGSAL